MKKLKLEKYDFVIIIGNGFDLNLGLKTSYSDFLESQQFDELLDDVNSVAIYLRDKKNLKKWIDIENELKNYSIEDLPRFQEDFNELSDSLVSYLDTLDYNNTNSSCHAIKLLSEISNDFSVLIIDYNYTSTISMLLKRFDIDLKDSKCKIEHIKIHGSVDEGNIIFGVEDKANILSKHIFLKKSVNKNFNPTDFSEALKNSKNVVFFGHSLGETDHMYFDNFFQTAALLSKTRKIVIFYYGDKNYYEINSQLDVLTLKSIEKLKRFNEFKMIDTSK